MVHTGADGRSKSISYCSYQDYLRMVRVDDTNPAPPQGLHNSRLHPYKIEQNIQLFTHLALFSNNQVSFEYPLFITMQFPFRISQLLQVDSSTGISLLNGHSLGKSLKQMKPQNVKSIADVINRMGNASATAQNLKQVITTFEKFVGSDNRMYLKVEDNKVLGMLKVGERNLFYRDSIGNIKELRPTCVLDFYVHESCQRLGLGKELLKVFLSKENKSVEKLAFDRPSDKLISFLRKHFNLVKYISQNNNYVIFNAYFDGSNKEPLVKENKELMKKELRPKEYAKEKEIATTSFKEAPLEDDRVGKTTTTTVPLKTTGIGKNKQYEVTSPWASISPETNNILFKTTSNSYGAHYRK